MRRPAAASQTVTFLSFSPSLFIIFLIIKNARLITDRGTNPLQRLIEERLRQQGWSYGEVARRGALPRSTVYNLARTRNLTRPPRPATIDGLAKGLGVPVSAVRAAAAESTGLHYYDEAAKGDGQDAEPLTDAAGQGPPASGGRPWSLAADLVPVSPGDLAEAVHTVSRQLAGIEGLARWTGPDPRGDLPPGGQARGGHDTTQFLARVAMLLTSATARRYWKDHLGLDTAAAAETAGWAIRILASAERAQREAEAR